MKIYTKVVMDIDTFEVVEEESYEYDGPMALCALNKPINPPPGGNPLPWTPDPPPPAGNIPIAWSESRSKSKTASGMDWNNPFIQSQLAGIGPQSANFQVPDNAIPFSSSFNYQGMDFSNPYVQQMYGQIMPGVQGFSTPTSAIPYSAQQSSNVSAEDVGIDWSDPFASQILPMLTQTAQGLPSLASGMEDTLTTGYSEMLRNALGPGAFQPTLNDLSKRGMINSTVASDALRGTATNISNSISNQAFAAKLASQQAQMGVPTALGDLAKLAQTSTKRQQAQSSALQEDPSAPYAIQAGYNTDMLKALADLGIFSTSQSYQQDPTRAAGIMADYYPSMLNALANLGQTSSGSQSSSSYSEDPSRYFGA